MIPLLGSLFSIYSLFINNGVALWVGKPLYILLNFACKKRHLRGFQRTSCPLVESLRGKASQVGKQEAKPLKLEVRGKASQVGKQGAKPLKLK